MGTLREFTDLKNSKFETCSIETRENEEGEKISRVVMHDDKPAFKTAIRGVTKIDTESWLLNPNLNSTDLIRENKHFFYKVKYKSIPEFFYENHMVKFKQSEKDAIDEYVKSKREKLAKQEEEEKQKALNEKVSSSTVVLHFHTSFHSSHCFLGQ